MAKEKIEGMELVIGDNLFVESVTSNFFVGRLVSVDGPHTVTLDDAAWIYDTGRLHLFMRNGRADGMEVEPVGKKTIHWASHSPWPFECFKESIG